ncbi:MAG: lipoprotein [Candidatus Eremiobacteraeota bacterium]|nr:lipoprotein [Candidatus Eremiobacteraeota bacterium]
MRRHSHTHTRLAAAALPAAALLLALGGCGQKGPLYLPDKSAPVVTSPASPAPAAPQPSPPPRGQTGDDDGSQPPRG